MSQFNEDVIVNGDLGVGMGNHNTSVNFDASINLDAFINWFQINLNIQEILKAAPKDKVIINDELRFKIKHDLLEFLNEYPPVE